MPCRGLAAGALALLAATVSCVAGEGDDEGTVQAPDERPLDLTIDKLDIAHGALRMSATMSEGSADVSLLVGEACGYAEIGRGMANRSTFVWALAEDEVALALKCDLVVRARVVTETGRVVKSAPLSVSSIVGSSGADEGPQLQGTSSSAQGIVLAFGSGELAISQLDFARAVVLQRPFIFEGASFPASISVGGVELQVEPDVVAPDPEPSEQEPTGTEPTEPGEPSKPNSIEEPEIGGGRPQD
jgi:hypothetical protein